MNKLLPVIVIIGAAGVGVGGGAALRFFGPKPAPPKEETHAEADTKDHDKSKPAADDHASEKKKKKGGHGEAKDASTIMKFSRQFVVPTVRDGAAVAMTILDISLVLDGSVGQEAYASELKLRDAFVRVLLRYAGDGRIAGIFEDQATLESVKADLLVEAQSVIGEGVQSALIVDVGYQEY